MTSAQSSFLFNIKLTTIFKQVNYSHYEREALLILKAAGLGDGIPCTSPLITDK